MENLPAVRTGIFDKIETFKDAIEAAEILAASSGKQAMVPVQFQGNVPNCMIALNLASRLGADVFMLMQTMYIIHGKPGIEGKMAIAMINSSGRFGPVKYESRGNLLKADNGQDGCRLVTAYRETGEEIKGPWITWDIVKAEKWLDKAGSKWQTMPEIMFEYRAASWFAKTVCPDVMLGMQTTEELHDMKPVGGYTNMEITHTPGVENTGEPSGVEYKIVDVEAEVISDTVTPSELKWLHTQVTAKGYDPEGVKASMAAYEVREKGQPVKRPFDVGSSKDILSDGLVHWGPFLESVGTNHDLLTQIRDDNSEADGWAVKIRNLMAEMKPSPVPFERHIYCMSSAQVAAVIKHYPEWLEAYKS